MEEKVCNSETNSNPYEGNLCQVSGQLTPCVCIGANWVLLGSPAYNALNTTMAETHHSENCGNNSEGGGIIGGDFNTLEVNEDDIIIKSTRPQEAIGGTLNQSNPVSEKVDRNTNNGVGNLSIIENKDLSADKPKGRQCNNFEKNIEKTLLNHSMGDSGIDLCMVERETTEIATQAMKNESIDVQSQEREVTKGVQNYEQISTEAVDGIAVNEEGDETDRWLEWIEQQFKEIAGEDGIIDFDEFKTALKVKKSFFAERFFALFDKDGSGTIELPELMEGLLTLSKGTRKQKLKFIFDVYDVDGSGSIDVDELKVVLKSCMEESSLQLSEENLDELTLALFEEADEDGSGAISFEELVVELEKHPGVMENLTISAAQWLQPPEESKQERSFVPRYLSKQYFMNNTRKVVFVIVYFIVNLILAFVGGALYRKSNIWIIIARAMGMPLNFNCTFILVLMLRYCLTWLRSTRIAGYLPLDQSVLFHKMVGYVILVETVIHTGAHFGNIVVVVGEMQESNTKLMNLTDFSNSTMSSITFLEFLVTTKSGIGWLIPGFAYISGLIVTLSLFIMIVCSLSCVRRSGFFQVFYWSHFLYVIFWIFLILHCPRFVYFFALPGLIFILERIFRSQPVKMAKYGRISIKEIHLLPSKVTQLVISKPEGLRFQPGDYIFIKIPAITNYEWHPFTISSAPELNDYFWVHIRSAGHWTNKVYEFFDNYQEERSKLKSIQIEDGKESLKESRNSHPAVKMVTFKKLQNDLPAVTKDSLKERKQSVKKRKSHKITDVEVYIDGPYGSPTREIFETEHAVLIGSGIGVTPYASILQSIFSRYKATRQQCPDCQHVWYGEIGHSVMATKKVDFIWINRDQKSFEWFVSLLTQLEIQQAEIGAVAEGFLEMQMYMTSAFKKSDMKGLGLQMALEILHKRDKKDLITGLKTKTQPGRPDWKEVLGKIATENKGKVKVFFCGSPALAKQLKEMCGEFGFAFSKENF